jgi:pimeloyl-ACP methyl ester carboxylesterase
MRSLQTRFDVAAIVGLDEAVQVTGSLHLPDVLPADARLELLVCLHGGGYRRSYWHPPFGANDEYSFARYFTDHGKAVLALDQLGMGDSSKPEPESLLSRAKIAAANAHALSKTVLALGNGQWAHAGSISVTGIGHSIGGMMMITQAAVHQGLDRVAVLGWANQPMVLGDTDVATLTQTLIPVGYLPSPRAALRSLFYLPDVPAQIVAADENTATATPSCLGRDALTPGIVHTESAAITVPVLVVHGVVDTSPNPWGEVPYFEGSNDVTLSVLEGSAHCHNLAATRRLHWKRLNRWIDSLLP